MFQPLIQQEFCPTSAWTLKFWSWRHTTPSGGRRVAPPPDEDDRWLLCKVCEGGLQRFSSTVHLPAACESTGRGFTSRWVSTLQEGRGKGGRAHIHVISPISRIARTGGLRVHLKRLLAPIALAKEAKSPGQESSPPQEIIIGFDLLALPMKS